MQITNIINNLTYEILDSIKNGCDDAIYQQFAVAAAPKSVLNRPVMPNLSTMDCLVQDLPDENLQMAVKARIKQCQHIILDYACINLIDLLPIIDRFDIPGQQNPARTTIEDFVQQCNNTPHIGQLIIRMNKLSAQITSMLNGNPDIPVSEHDRTVLADYPLYLSCLLSDIVGNDRTTNLHSLSTNNKDTPWPTHTD